MSKDKKSGKKAKATSWGRPVAAEPDLEVPGPQEEEEEAEPEAPADRPDPARCVVDAAMRAAMSDDLTARLKGDGAFVVAVRAPAPAWVKSLESRFKRLCPRARIMGRDGSDRSRHKSDSGNDEVAETLAEGKVVIGIAASIALLPSSLATGADATIEIALDGTVVGEAIAKFTGTSSAALAIEGLGALDFHDIVVSFRPESSAADIVERLRRAAQRRTTPRQDRLPNLIDAVEFGEAREWGLELGRDLAEYYNTGSVALSDLSANCVFAGDPGLGKTFFARILARHLGIPLVSGSISEIFATTAGNLDSVVKGARDLFAQAEATQSALFLDEIDALPSRVDLRDHNSSWWGPVIAEFLLLLDSSQRNNHKLRFVWAATNHVDRLDPALIRPGRLDRVIHFKAPGPDGIASIIRHHLNGDLAGADLTAIGQLGLGRTPASLAAVVKTARRLARAERRSMTYDDLVEALAPRGDIDAATLRRIAIHESGHAVVAIALGVDEIVAIDAIGNSGAWGRTVMRRRSGIELRATIENRVTANLAGRAAELVVFQNCSANAGGDPSSDLALASHAIAELHVSMGLGGEGALAYLGDPADLLRRDPRLQAAVNGDLTRLHARAVDIVTGHRAALEAIAAALADRRHLTGDEVREMFLKHAPESDFPRVGS